MTSVPDNLIKMTQNKKRSKLITLDKIDQYPNSEIIETFVEEKLICNVCGNDLKICYDNNTEDGEFDSPHRIHRTSTPYKTIVRYALISIDG